MIGNDESREGHQDETEFKVTDRRKYNPDGSVKDGVVIEETPARTAEPKSEDVSPTDVPTDAVVPGETPETPEAGTSAGVVNVPADGDDLPEVGVFPDDDLEDPDDEVLKDLSPEELAQVNDPASFINFLTTLATNAAAALGAVPHPATGQRSVDLETGKYWLEVLAMLRDKTQGNLGKAETRLLEGLLADLRMQYVGMVRATEEQLKADAAKKFSDADILGKR